MNRLTIFSCCCFVLLALSGCVAQIDRPTNTSVPTPTTEGSTPPSPTTETPTPTSIPVPIPTPTPTQAPVPTPTPIPPVFLEISEPDYGITVLSRSITVRGTTNPNNTVTANNRRAVVNSNGEFSVEVFLVEGINVIEVLATNALGEQVREFIPVTYVKPTPIPFTLLVTDPLDRIIVAKEFIAVAGRTAPYATVTVNGVGVAVDDDGDFSTVVKLTRGINTIEVLARNTDNSSLSAQRTVIFNP